MNYNFIHKTYTFYLWGIYLMKNMVLAFTFFFLCLSAQSNEEVKKQLQNLGISSDKAKNIAKQQGYDKLQNKSARNQHDKYGNWSHCIHRQCQQKIKTSKIPLNLFIYVGFYTCSLFLVN